MNLFIFFTALISVSLADDRLFQYCDVDTCEDVKKYTILEYQDLCFEEKIVKFENSLGATNYVGLNDKNVASKIVKLCGASENTATDTTEEPFFNKEKNQYAQKFLIEFVNDVNDYIYMIVIFFQFCLIIRKKVCKTFKKLKKALERILKKQPKKVVNEYSVPTFFPSLFVSRPETSNSSDPAIISGEINCKPTLAIQTASAPIEIVSEDINYTPTSANQTEASFPAEIVSYYACSCKGPCTTCGCALRQQQCTKFCHKGNFNENCTRINY